MEANAAARLIEDWLNAVGQLDAQGVVALYAEDAQFWGTMASRLALNRAEIGDYFARFLDRLRMRVSVLDIQWQTRNGLVLAAGAYRFCWQDSPDREAVDARARFSFLLGPTDQGWRILQHHSSPWVVGGL